MIDVDAILDSVSLVDLVTKAGGNPYKSYGEWRCACPLHGGDNETGFAIYNDKGREKWKCFTGNCGGGDAISFVEVWQKTDFKGACGFLDGKIIDDPQEMIRLSQIRAENAKRELEEAIAKAQAARAQLEAAQMHVHYHENMKEWGRLAWVQRGIDESYQALWSLGSCDDKKIMYKGQEYHTPTLTIPLVDSNYSLLNIKHRLLNPPKPNDKYRPEREGLGAFPPFYAWPDMEYKADMIWIMEGEIKSMVTATISPDAGWQYIGVPGQDAFDKMPVEKLAGKNVIVIPDPNAELKAYQFAKKIHAKFIILPDKIDDLIVENEYGGDWLASLYKQARKV